MSQIDELLRNAKAYASAFAAAGRGGRSGRPGRELAIVACMDARLDVQALLGLHEGDAHVIRNAGGLITDDAIRSLLISQRLLGTTEIMLIHHTRCGMTTFTDEELIDQIGAETGFRPPFELGAFADIEADVRESIHRIETNPFLPSKIVRGFVYDVDDGSLREVV
jgi:carbonic anhydrase